MIRYRPRNMPEPSLESGIGSSTSLNPAGWSAEKEHDLAAGPQAELGGGPLQPGGLCTNPTQPDMGRPWPNTGGIGNWADAMEQRGARIIGVGGP